MFFIALLIASTTAIAGAAAYFSVYGLAYTFSGVFWSVVAMGASLEVGKLIAASYLYRYWDKTNTILRSYLMFGVAALMLLTSVGIFGYLSSGYQQDVLPLKQKTEQVQLLEAEKARLLARKQQIDNIIAGSATVNTVEGTKGIDRNAVRALRETTRARESLVRQYRSEQTDATKRIKDLDAELLALKQDLIKVEAHIGPITYIANAFDLPTDNATKYLIFLIIFAFDPMAVALTLAVNTALRIRREEKEGCTHVMEEEAPTPISLKDATFDLGDQEPLEAELQQVLDDNRWDLYEREPVQELEPLEFSYSNNREQEEPTVEMPVVKEPKTDQTKVQSSQPELGSTRRHRPYPALWQANTSLTSEKIDELVNHYQYLNNKVRAGETLSNDELWERDAVKNVLVKAGYSHYL